MLLVIWSLSQFHEVLLSLLHKLALFVEGLLEPRLIVLLDPQHVVMHGPQLGDELSEIEVHLQVTETPELRTVLKHLDYDAAVEVDGR